MSYLNDINDLKTVNDDAQDGDIITIHYTLSADIVTNGEDPEFLRNRFNSAMERAVGYGAITGETSAVCDEYSAETVLISQAAANLSEADIVEWLTDKIADGNMTVEQLVEMYAKAALSSEAEMRSELAERMGLDEDHEQNRQDVPRG